MSLELSSLPADIIARYSRQLLLPGWSLAKQQRLSQRRIFLDLRLPTALEYLAASGCRHFLFNRPLEKRRVQELRAVYPDIQLEQIRNDSIDVDCSILIDQEAVSARVSEIPARYLLSTHSLIHNETVLEHRFPTLGFSEHSWRDYASMLAISHLFAQLMKQ